MFSNVCQKVKYKENDSEGEENWAGTINKDFCDIFTKESTWEDQVSEEIVQECFNWRNNPATTRQNTHADTVYGHRKLALNSFPNGHKDLLLEL